MSKKLFVGNLSFQTSESDITNTFAQYGAVESVQIITDRDTGRSKGFGFVVMDQEGADKAIASLNGSQVDGRALTASELARAAGVTPQTASGHLARLTAAGLLGLHCQGRHHYHRLASPAVARMLEGIIEVTAASEADPEVARLKSSADLVKAIEAAVRFYEKPPAKPMAVETDWSDIWLSAGDWAEAFGAPEAGTPHNEARGQILEELVTILVDKRDDNVPADELRKSLLQNRELITTLNRAWPLIEADDLVGDLWSVPAYLRMCAPWLSPEDIQKLQRPDAQAWTVSDLPLLDAARQRLGDPQATRRQRRHDAAVAAEREQMTRLRRGLDSDHHQRRAVIDQRSFSRFDLRLVETVENSLDQIIVGGRTLRINDSMGFVIEGDFAPLIVETVAVQLYFLRLLFAFFGDLLGE